jgi:hypothetical protein
MVVALADYRVVAEHDVDEAFARVNAALADALALLGEFDAQGGWEIAGAASAVSWLAGRGMFTRTEAATHVRNARLLRHHHEVERALQAGTITPAHVTQLSSIARHRSQKFGEDVTLLVETATHVDPEGYRQVTTHWRSLADDLLAPEARDDRNALDVAESYAGSWVLRGVFDPVRGAALHALLLERSAPCGPNDERNASERRADALFEALTGGRPVQPRVDVLVDVDTFVGVDRPLEDVRCELQGVGAIDRIVMERLACNAHVGRVLTRGTHEVLELGRRVRLAAPAQRRAVIARDRGCVWPHCHRPAAMCEVHHLVPWQAGGPTDVTNLALLCGRHHTRVHQGWTLQQAGGGIWDASPP